MSDGPAYASGQPEQSDGGAGGFCATCGRELPPPDLEAVAASIDQTLSLEAGRVVPRTAWAGRPPDGVKDALLFWLPSVKANRQLWERGQTLWTDQMTAALSGPCAACQGAAAPLPPGAPAPTFVQQAEQSPAPMAPTAYLHADPTPPREDAPSGMPPTEFLRGSEDLDEPKTSAIPAYSDYPDAQPTQMAAPVPAVEPPTSAMSSYASGFGGTAPADQPSEEHPSPPQPSPSDEHESHTVMLTSLPSLRAATRLVVVEGPVRGRQFSLGRDRTTIGRSIGCHITVEADSVEYDHASVVRAGTGWKVELAGTAADLYVNDEPVRDSRPLSPGDIIRIGPAQLRFESVP